MPRIIITANGYPEINDGEIEVSEEELKRRIESGEIWLCTAGCNETGMNYDPQVYHQRADCRS